MAVAAVAALVAGLGVTTTGTPVAAVAPLCGILQNGAHVVTTPAELAEIGKGTNDCRLSDNYVLGNTIDLASAPWTPIGPETVGDQTTFTGTFDGAGYSINGLFIDYTGELAYDDTSIEHKGLFGVTGAGAVIRDVTVSGSVRGGTRVGGVIGAAFSTTVSGVVSNVTVSGLNVVGGLIGQAHDSQIIGSTSNGAVSNTNADQFGGTWFYGTGGLIGVGERIAITGSLATGDVTAVKYDPANPGTELGRSSSVGGLLGDSNTWATISASSATGDVTGSNFVGGLVGYMWADGTNDGHDRSLVDVSATGRVDGLASVGGLVGSLKGDGTVQRASASGDVVAMAPSSSTDRSTGGLIGYAASFTSSDGVGPKLVVSDVSASGDVAADGEFVGGLVGFVDEVAITNAQATGSLVEGGSKTGGLVGRLTLSSIIRGVAFADVSGSAGAFMIGGLVGEADGMPSAESLISESAAYGDVSGVAGIGGLVGYNGWWTNIERSFALGDVTGSALVGGLLGEVYDIDIVDSFSRGAVTAEDAKAGALAGLVEDYSVGTASVNRSYASGAVLDTDPANGDGNAAPEGLIFRNTINATTSAGATVSASFWDASVSAVTSSTQGGDPKSTAELTDVATFRDAGWAIVDGWVASNPPTAVWGICPQVNDGYPFLLWAYDSTPCGGGSGNGSTGGSPVPPPPPTSGESISGADATARSGFVPMTPLRRVDTREGQRIAAGQILEVAVAGRDGVPVDATAVALSVTAVDPVGAGFITVYPCGSARPLASTLNYVAGSTIANAATIALGAGGGLCVFSSATTDVIVDLNGFWSPNGTGLVTSIVPTRVLDTRTGTGRVAAGTTTAVDVSSVVPAGAIAVAVNVTAVDAGGAGFVTVFPCGAGRPLASNLNVVAGSTVPVSVLVGRGADGRVCVFSSTVMDVVVDVTAWFGATGSASLVSGGPTRLLDTRDTGARAQAGSVTRVPVPAGASAVALNVTAVDPAAASFITVYPCGAGRPLASNLNVVAGQIRANQVVVGTDGGDVCVYTQAPTHLVLDRTAAFAT